MNSQQKFNFNMHVLKFSDEFAWKSYFRSCILDLDEEALNKQKSLKYANALKICLHNRDINGAEKWFKKYNNNIQEGIEKYEDTTDDLAIINSDGITEFKDNNEDRYLKMCDIAKKNYETFTTYIDILKFKLDNNHF